MLVIEFGVKWGDACALLGAVCLQEDMLGLFYAAGLTLLKVNFVYSAKTLAHVWWLNAYNLLDLLSCCCCRSTAYKTNTSPIHGWDANYWNVNFRILHLISGVCTK